MTETTDDGTILAGISQIKAYRKGIIDMRERAAQAIEAEGHGNILVKRAAKIIRALPVEGE